MKSKEIKLSLLGVAVVLCSMTASAQPDTYSATLDRLNIRHQTIAEGMPPVDLSDWPVDGASTGLQVVRLPGSQVGLPVTQYPSVRFISTGQLRDTDVSQLRSGLYLVDIDYVPPDLPENLRTRGYQFNADGTLVDENGDSIAAPVG